MARNPTDWTLPPSMRREESKPPTDDAAAQTIKHARPDDPVFNAMMLLAQQQFEEANALALNESITPEQRQYRAGYAAASMDYLIQVRSLRGE